jgi:hypothetical protein
MCDRGAHVGAASPAANPESLASEVAPFGIRFADCGARGASVLRIVSSSFAVVHLPFAGTYADSFSREISVRTARRLHDSARVALARPRRVDGCRYGWLLDGRVSLSRIRWRRRAGRRRGSRRRERHGELELRVVQLRIGVLLLR